MNNVGKENTILQIKYPIITSYTSDAHMLAILNNYPSTEEWIFNNYINLWGERPPDNEDAILIRFHSWLINRVCPYFKISHYGKDYFKTNIPDFLISIIDSGKYAAVLYDQYYVPISELYMNMHNEHGMLIYGYDKKMKIFYAADFFKKMKYSFATVSFDCIESAIINVLESELFGCEVIEFNNSNYKFSKSFLYNSLNNFLYSKNIAAENENVIIGDAELEQIQKGRYTFGMKNYDLLKETLSRVLYEKKRFFDLKPLHVIFDHKVMMCERIKYLLNSGVIDNSDSILDKYINIKNKSEINRSLIVKFRITKDYGLIDKIINNINIVESLEKEAVTYLINICQPSKS